MMAEKTMDAESYFLSQVDIVNAARLGRLKRELREAGVPNVDEWNFEVNSFSADAKYQFKSKMGYTYKYRYEGLGFGDQGRFKLNKVSKNGKYIDKSFVGDWEYMVLITAAQLEQDEYKETVFQDGEQ